MGEKTKIFLEYMKKAIENRNIMYVENYYIKKREEEASGYLINYMDKRHNRTKHEVFIEDNFFTALGLPLISVAIDHQPFDYYVDDHIAKYFYKIFKPKGSAFIGSFFDTYKHKLEVICKKKVEISSG